uniref:Serpentine receptor class gamma n=1 Tax=Meloidogyne incognita TaxID=6306 RepID=A0A914MZ18_MELIC
MNWFENPYFGYSIKINLKEYVNFVNLWYDLFLVFGFPAIYLFFIVMFCIRLKEIKAIANIEQRKLKITVFIQIAIIIGLNISSTLIFFIMQHLPLHKIMVLTGYYVNYFVFALIKQLEQMRRNY